MNRKIKSQLGFTMIELMVTVVIIGIVAAIAVPRFSIAYERMSFRSSNKEVVSKIRLARSMAISNKDYFGVHFNETTKIVSLFKKDSASSNYNVFETADSVISADTLSRSFSTLTTDLANEAIAFRPNGSAIFGGGGNVVSIVSNDDIVGIYNINILASTGRVKSTGYYY